MKGLHITILMSILSVLYALPTGIKKRAHPYLSLPSKSTNTTVIKPQSQNSSETVPNKTVAAKTTTEELCPTHQVAHNTSKGIVCCVPYFNCGIDHGIKACSKDGERDQCIPCPPGMIQKNNVSSLNMEEAECYTTRNSQNCAKGDLKPSWWQRHKNGCFYRCECKNEECFYGNDPCACGLSNPCPLNFTMNRVTGVCEKCPWYAYKDYVGCGTCTVVPELWAQRNSHTPVTEKPFTEKKTILETTSKASDDTTILETTTKASDNTTILETTTKASDDTGGAETPDGETVITTGSILVVDGIVIALTLVVVLVVLVCVIGVIAYCLRRSKMTGSSSRLITDPGPGKPVGSNEKNLLTELADGYQTVANRPNVIRGPEPAVEQRPIEGNIFAYEELGASGGYDGRVDDQKVQNDSFDDTPERMGAPPEEVPLLKDPMRHNGCAPHRQHVQYPEAGANDSDDAQSHLLQIRKSILHNDEKSGARPKTNLPKYTRPLNGTKSERTSSAERFKNCTFKKCSVPALVNSIKDDDCSLYTSESSDYSLFNPPDKVPLEVDVLNSSKVVPRKDRQNNDFNLDVYMPPNELDDCEIDMSEPTSSINVIVLLNETKPTDERKHISAKQKTLSKCNDLDPDSFKPYTSNKDEIFVDKLGGHDKDMHDNGVENDKDHITFEKAKLVDKQSVKKISLEIPKPDISSENEADLKKTEAGSGTTSPARSNGSESGSKRKIKPWGDNIKEEKPVARIEPIRQNFTLESRQQEPAPMPSYGGYSVLQNHDARYRLYMSDLVSDSYPMLHAQHPPSDDANMEDLNPLDPTSIDSSVRSIRSQHQCGDSVVSNTELFHNEMHEREGSEGCSLQQSSTNSNDESYRYRPDLQRTYSKTVERNEETNLAKNIAENLREETFLKKRNYSDRKTGDKGNNVSESDGTCRCELDDVVDKEELKNSDVDKDNETKNRDGNLESEEETAMLKLNEEPKACQGKSDETLESEIVCETEICEERVTCDSSNYNDNEACAASERSVEKGIDFVAASKTDANSVDLLMDIADQISDSYDSIDIIERSKIEEDIRRRES